MSTSASTLIQEGVVPSVVEFEGTPPTAGVEGAVVELAATDFQGFLKEGTDNVSGNPVVVDQPLTISTREPAEVADPELQAKLRKHDVDERLILEIGAPGVKTIADFVGLEGTEAEMKNTLASSFGIEGTTVKGKVAIGRALNAWRSASSRASEYEAAAAQCKCLGQPVELQDPEYHLYIGSLARSRGVLLEDCDIPGRCFSEMLGYYWLNGFPTLSQKRMRTSRGQFWGLRALFLYDRI